MTWMQLADPGAPGDQGDPGPPGAVRWFNVLDFGARRSPGLDFDSTFAFLLACQAAADFAEAEYSGLNGNTGVVYTPAGTWVGRYEYRGNGVLVLGDGKATQVWAPLIGAGEAAAMAGAGLAAVTAYSPPTSYAMVGFVDSSMPTPTARDIALWGLRDIWFWTHFDGTNSTRRVLDTTPPIVSVNHGSQVIDNVESYGYAGDIAFYIGASCADMVGDNINASGPAEAMVIDCTDSQFSNLQLNGGFDPEDACCRIRAADNRVVNSKFYAGGVWVGGSASAGPGGPNQINPGPRPNVHGLSIEAPYNQVDNCEAQDCTGRPLIVQSLWAAGDTSQFNQGHAIVRNFLADGNKLPVAIRDSQLGHNDIEVFYGPADFGYTTPSALDLIGTVGPGNSFKIHTPPGPWSPPGTTPASYEGGGFQAVRLLAGPGHPATVSPNPAPSLDGQEVIFASRNCERILSTSVGPGATVAVDPRVALTWNITLTTNSTISAPQDVKAVMPGEILLFIITQGGLSGPYTVTFDPVYGPVPAVGTTGTSVLPFLNISSTLTPVWKYLGAATL